MKLQPKTAEYYHQMLEVLPRLYYKEEDRHTKVITKDPRQNRWDPHTQDVVSFLCALMKMWQEEKYSLESRHNYLLKCIPFCESHLETAKYGGLYTK